MDSTVDVVKFEDPAVRRKRLAQSWAAQRSHTAQKKNTNQTDQIEGKSEGFDVEEARFEILKFGIDNDKQKDRRLNAKQQLLISLGAKPPKKKCQNYKVLKEELKIDKEAFVTELRHHDSSQPNQKKPLNKKKRKAGLNITAGFGKLKNGELIVGSDTRNVMRKVQQKARKRQEKQKAGKLIVAHSSGTESTWKTN